MEHDTEPAEQGRLHELLKLDSIEQSFQVRFNYSVHFTSGLFGCQNPLLRDVIRNSDDPFPKKLVFIIDEEVCRLHPKLLTSIEKYCRHHKTFLDAAQSPLLVPGGEAAKNDPSLISLAHNAINQHSICRHSFVVAIGGGAVIDMAGYAAATAHRGVRLIRAPTTVLSQNDSAVGVKNGINYFDKKNFLGTFTPPYAVLIDFDFLTTLPDRMWRSGIAEAVKVALIKDEAFFEFLSRNLGALIDRDMTAMQELIHRCAKLHLRHIATSGDPFELGSSRPLDFGHWAAHKLEQLTGYRLQHGEAVAIGVALDSTYSYLSGSLAEADWQRIINLLIGLGFHLYVPELTEYLDQPYDPRSIFRGLGEFQEHLGGRLTIMLLDRIGHGFEVHEMDEAMISKSIDLLRVIVNNPSAASEWPTRMSFMSLSA